MTSLNDIYFVWSVEHNGWWGPGHRGYVNGLKHAGEYTRDEALKICADALGTAAHIGRIAEIPVRRQDVFAFLADRLVPTAVWGKQ